MAVGGGARHLLRGDHPSRAGRVLHHERPAEGVGELRRQHARQHVGVATRRRRGDEPHALRRIRILREGISSQKQYQQENSHQPRLSTNRGGFTAASKSLAIVPRGSSVTSGVTWNILLMRSTMPSLPPARFSTWRCRTSLSSAL